VKVYDSVRKGTLVRSSRGTREGGIQAIQRQPSHTVKEEIAMTQERKKVGAKLEEHLKPEELKKKKKVGELDDTELDGISGGEGMDTGKIIP